MGRRTALPMYTMPPNNKDINCHDLFLMCVCCVWCWMEHTSYISKKKDRTWFCVTTCIERSAAMVFFFWYICTLYVHIYVDWIQYFLFCCCTIFVMVDFIVSAKDYKKKLLSSMFYTRKCERAALDLFNHCVRRRVAMWMRSLWSCAKFNVNAHTKN